MEKQHLKKALSNCGYPKWAITNATRNKGDYIQERPITIVSFPYVKGFSEQIQRICNQFGIRVAHRPVQTLRHLLVHPKDKQEKERISGVVYGIHCEGENCNEFYVGETEQPLKKRMYQHRRNAGEGVSSAVHNHLDESGHIFQNENVDILCKESNWFERGVHEAIYIKALNPSLNKQGGARFKLSSAWEQSIGVISKSARSRVNAAVPAIQYHPIEGDGMSPKF